MVNIRHLRRPRKELQNVPPVADPTKLNTISGWEKIPLDQKLPDYSVPFEASGFCCETLGEPLWKSPDEFAQFDPKLNFYDFKYEPLNDKSMKQFFEKNRRLMEAIGQVGPDGEVYCSLKELNAFRAYLNQLRLLHVRKIIRKKDKDAKDTKVYQIIEGRFQKEAKRKDNRRTRDEILEEILDKKLARTKEILANYESAFRQHRLRLYIQKTKRELRRKLRQSQEEKRIENQLEKERQRNLDLVLKLRKRDDAYEEAKEREILHQKEQKEARKYTRYQMRLAAREKFTRLEEQLLNEYNREMEENIQKRKKEFEKLQKRMERKLEAAKAHRIQQKYSHADSSNLKKALKSSVKKLLRKKRTKRSSVESQKSLEPDEITLSEQLESFYSMTRIKNISQVNQKLEVVDPELKALRRLSSATIGTAVDCALDAFHYLKSIPNSLSLLEIACDIIKSSVRTPDSVLPSDDYVLNYSRARVRSTIETVKREVKEGLRILLETRTMEKCGSNLCRTVTFGEFSTHDISIDADLDLKSVKGRPPTPVPSLEDLAGAVMIDAEDVIELPPESQSTDVIHLSESQKCLIERNCDLFARLLKTNLEKKCVAAIDFKKKEVLELYSKLIGVDRDYLVDSMAVSIIKLPTDDLNFGSNLYFAVNVVATEVLIEVRLELEMQKDQNKMESG